MLVNSRLTFESTNEDQSDSQGSVGTEVVKSWKEPRRFEGVNKCRATALMGHTADNGVGDGVGIAGLGQSVKYEERKKNS